MADLQEIYNKLLDIEKQLQTLSNTKHQKIHDLLGLTKEKGKVSLSEVMERFGINSRTYAIDLMKSVGCHKDFVFRRGNVGMESFVCKEELMEDWELLVALLTKKDYEKNRVIELEEMKTSHGFDNFKLQKVVSELVATGLWERNPPTSAFIRRAK